MILDDANSPAVERGRYVIAYGELVDGYRHAYEAPVGKHGYRTKVRYTRNRNHPPDPRCPECHPTTTPAADRAPGTVEGVLTVGDEWTCDCGRGPVAVFVGKTRTSLIVRRFRDVPHTGSWDGLCLDCVADAAAEIASYVRPSECDCDPGPEGQHRHWCASEAPTPEARAETEGGGRG